jgi:DNA polymerase-3 subunit epsilon
LESGTQRHIELEHGSLEWEETAGELGASLRELALIRALAPRYNRKYKSDEAWSVRWDPTSGIEIIDLRTPHKEESLYGMFRRRIDAVAALRGLARAYELCLKTLDLEHSDGPCAAYGTKLCRGACIGREPAIAHTARLITALARLRVPAWRFEGPIVVREQDPRRGLHEAHVFDRWRYVGSARTDSELSDMLAQPSVPNFDIEYYKLIRRYLAQPHSSLERPHSPRKGELVHW